jgi:DNA-binding LacI/PurR family transcriptional regulator
MRDVARLANVSQSTVSRVLSGATDTIPIGEETRQRVLDAVKLLDYQPNLHAGSLRGQKTRMIAVMIADIGNPFYHPMVRAIQDIANQYKYDVMVSNSDHTLEGEQHFLDSVLRRPVDGIIMVPYHLGDEEIDQITSRTGAAVGVVGQHFMHSRADVAFGDDGKAVTDTVCWLVGTKGHQRIAFIGVQGKFNAAVRRQRAFETGLEGCGIAVDSDYMPLGDWSPESGYRAMLELLTLPARPTAVFACNDLMAIGAMEAIRQQGLVIPRDIALVGFDDIPPASWLSPRLTTVAQYPHQMGSLLAQSLFSRFSGDFRGPGRRLEVPCRLIVREST